MTPDREFLKEVLALVKGNFGGTTSTDMVTLENAIICHLTLTDPEGWISFEDQLPPDGEVEIWKYDVQLDSHFPVKSPTGEFYGSFWRPKTQGPRR